MPVSDNGRCGRWTFWREKPNNCNFGKMVLLIYKQRMHAEHNRLQKDPTSEIIMITAKTSHATYLQGDCLSACLEWPQQRFDRSPSYKPVFA